MPRLFPDLKRIVAALGATVLFCLPAMAGEAHVDALLDRLAEAKPAEARKIAAEIEMAWSNSGSPAMDLLLRRGKDAIEAGDTTAAIEHLGALIDHAPEFAEAWHLRSVAFFKQDRYGMALADIEHALALEPRQFNVLYGLGVLLDELGRHALAYEVFIRVEAIHPHHDNVSSARKRAARELGGAEL